MRIRLMLVSEKPLSPSTMWGIEFIDDEEWK